MGGRAMHKILTTLSLAGLVLLAAPAARADIFLVYLGPNIGYSIEGGTFGIETLTGGQKAPAPLSGGFHVGGTAGIKLFNFVGVQANVGHYLLDKPGALTSLTFEVALGPTIGDFFEIGVHGGGGIQWVDGENNPAVKVGALVGFRVHDWVEIGVDADADLWWLKSYAAANITLDAWIRLTI